MTADDSREQAIEIITEMCGDQLNAATDIVDVLADAGLLAGTANTTEAHGYSTWGETKLRAERDRARSDARAQLQVSSEWVVKYDRAVADLAALRDKVRALADEWERGHLAGLVGGYGMTMTHKDALVVRRLRALLTDGGQS